MAKLCTYIITNDTGLAPNPYHGWCTLSVCTPNHQGSKLTAGDWIAGFLNKSRGYSLIYLLRIDERIDLNSYYHDPRFESKKPNLLGCWQARCGDNFYSLSPSGDWKQHRNRFHIGSEYLAKDTKNPYVFVGKRFWYFGVNAPVPIEKFSSLYGGRGIRVNHDPELAKMFIAWVSDNWREGIHGIPNDNPDIVAYCEHN